MKVRVNHEKIVGISRTIFSALLKTFLKVGGFKAWLIKFAIEEAYDEIGEPIIKAGLVELGYVLDKREGKALVKKLNEATNANDYDSAVDDILS